MEYIVQIMFPVVAITVSILWLDSVILYFTCFGIYIYNYCSCCCSCALFFQLDYIASHDRSWESERRDI